MDLANLDLSQRRQTRSLAVTHPRPLVGGLALLPPREHRRRLFPSEPIMAEQQPDPQQQQPQQQEQQQQQNLIPPPPPIPQLQPQLLDLCHATQQQLMVAQPGLTVLSLCPACGVILARHVNEGNNGNLNVGAGIGVGGMIPAPVPYVARGIDTMKIYSTLEGIAKTFTKWSVQKVPVVFLRSLSNRLETSGVPDSHWYKILPLVTEKRENETNEE